MNNMAGGPVQKGTKVSAPAQAQGAGMMGRGDLGRQKPLGQVLKEMELVNEGQIQEALSIQRKEGGVLGDILVKLGYVAREEILLALAAQMGMEVVDLVDMEIPPDVINKVPPLMAKSYKVVPI